jgi:hypothetical protein
LKDHFADRYAEILAAIFRGMNRTIKTPILFAIPGITTLLPFIRALYPVAATREALIIGKKTDLPLSSKS